MLKRLGLSPGQGKGVKTPVMKFEKLVQEVGSIKFMLGYVSLIQILKL
jgi:hypothetical protein